MRRSGSAGTLPRPENESIINCWRAATSWSVRKACDRGRSFPTCTAILAQARAAGWRVPISLASWRVTPSSSASGTDADTSPKRSASVPREVASAEVHDGRLLGRDTGVIEGAERHLPEAAPQDLGHADLRGIRGEGDVVGGHQRHAAAQAVAVHLGDGDLGVVPEALVEHEVWMGTIPIPRRLVVELAQVAQVRAGTVAGSVAAGNDDPDLGVRADRLEGVEDLAGHHAVEGVALLGPVEVEPDHGRRRAVRAPGSTTPWSFFLSRPLLDAGGSLVVVLVVPVRDLARGGLPDAVVGADVVQGAVQRADAEGHGGDVGM